MRIPISARSRQSSLCLNSVNPGPALRLIRPLVLGLLCALAPPSIFPPVTVQATAQATTQAIVQATAQATTFDGRIGNAAQADPALLLAEWELEPQSAARADPARDIAMLLAKPEPASRGQIDLAMLLAKREPEPASGARTDPAMLLVEPAPQSAARIDPAMLLAEWELEPQSAARADPARDIARLLAKQEPENAARTDPALLLTKRKPGSGAQTDPALLLAKREPASGAQTDPAMLLAEREPQSARIDPAMLLTKRVPQSARIDPTMLLAEQKPASAARIDPAGLTKREPASGAQTDPAMLLTKRVPEPQSGAQTDPAMLLTKQKPENGARIDPAMLLAKQEPASGARIDPAMLLTKRVPASGARIDPALLLAERAPASGAWIDPAMLLAEREPGSGARTDPAMLLTKRKPGSGAQTDPAMLLTKRVPASGARIDPALLLAEREPESAARIDPAGLTKREPASGARIDPALLLTKRAPASGARIDPALLLAERGPASGARIDPARDLAGLLAEREPAPMSDARVNLAMLLAELKSAPESSNGVQFLYLEVFINGHPLKMIAEFRYHHGDMAARVSELRTLGIVPPVASGDHVWVNIAELPGGAFRYDESQQTIHLSLAAAALQLRQYSFRQGQSDSPLRPAETGAFLNYSVHGAYARQGGESNFSGIAANLEGWAFHPEGSLHTSFLLETGARGERARLRRLSSYFTRSEVEQQTNLRLGDVISGGLSWSRPIRLGGLQFRRNFATRPDLVRQPLPDFSGSAAVPSIVEIYQGSLKLARMEVQQGPFELDDIPVHIDNGELRVIVEGLQGSTAEYHLPFGTNQALLRSGLSSFSLEAGLARRGYGTRQDEYAAELLAITSLRRGLSDEVTVEFHGEASIDLINAGAGLVKSFGRWGTLSAALAGSLSDDKRGELLDIGYSIATGPFSLGASSQRRSRDYYDLADITARRNSNIFSPRASIISQDRIFTSITTPVRNLNLGLGYVHTENAAGDHRHSGTLSLRYPINRDIHFQARAQSNLTDFQDASIFFGLSMQLGSRYSTQTGLTWSADEVLGNVSISRHRGSAASDYGYSLRVRGNGNTQQASGQAYRQFEKLDASGNIVLRDASTNLSTQLRGSIALIDRNIHISRYINNSFVIVDAGYEDVLIKHENRGVGTTSRNGSLLIPNILPYEKNKISIDPKTLPIEAIISETDTYVRIPEHAGASVSFKGAEDKRIRINAYITRADGQEIPPGTPATVLNTNDTILIGHDGQLFFSTLDEHNRVQVLSKDKPCLVELTLPPGASGYVDIGELLCRPVVGSP